MTRSSVAIRTQPDLNTDFNAIPDIDTGIGLTRGTMDLREGLETCTERSSQLRQELMQDANLTP
jgi:hypothetical protein